MPGQSIRSFLRRAAIFSLIALFLDMPLAHVAGHLGWLDMHEPAYGPRSMALLSGSLLAALSLAALATLIERWRHSSATESRCPKCGAPMVERIARRGRYSGRKFEGCSRYPECDGVRPVRLSRG